MSSDKETKLIFESLLEIIRMLGALVQYDRETDKIKEELMKMIGGKSVPR